MVEQVVLVVAEPLLVDLTMDLFLIAKRLDVVEEEHIMKNNSQYVIIVRLIFLQLIQITRTFLSAN